MCSSSSYPASSVSCAVAENEAISLLLKKNIGVFLHEKVAMIPLEENIQSTIVLASNKPTIESECSGSHRSISKIAKLLPQEKQVV